MGGTPTRTNAVSHKYLSKFQLHLMREGTNVHPYFERYPYIKRNKDETQECWINIFIEKNTIV